MVCRFNDLVRRFERPDGKNRWDSRLFELHPGKGWSLYMNLFYSSMFRLGMFLLSHLLHVRAEDIHEGAQAIVEVVNFLTGDTNSAGARNSQMLQPTIATQNVRSHFFLVLRLMVIYSLAGLEYCVTVFLQVRFSETNSLYELDRATQVCILAPSTFQYTLAFMKAIDLLESELVILCNGPGNCVHCSGCSSARHGWCSAQCQPRRRTTYHILLQHLLGILTCAEYNVTICVIQHWILTLTLWDGCT